MRVEAPRPWPSRQRSSTDGGSSDRDQPGAPGRRLRPGPADLAQRRASARRPAAAGGRTGPAPRPGPAASPPRPASSGRSASRTSRWAVARGRLGRVDRHPEVDHRVDQFVPGGVRVLAGPAASARSPPIVADSRRRPAPSAATAVGLRRPSPRAGGGAAGPGAAPAPAAAPAAGPWPTPSAGGRETARRLVGRAGAPARRSSTSRSGRFAAPGPADGVAPGGAGAPATAPAGSAARSVSGAQSERPSRPRRPPGWRRTGPSRSRRSRPRSRRAVAVGQRVRVAVAGAAAGEAERHPGRDAGGPRPSRPSPPRTAGRSPPCSSGSRRCPSRCVPRLGLQAVREAVLPGEVVVDRA